MTDVQNNTQTRTQAEGCGNGREVDIDALLVLDAAGHHEAGLELRAERETKRREEIER